MKRRTIQRVLVFLFLGAIVNVSVAWGCSWRASSEALDIADEEFRVYSDVRASLHEYAGYAVVNILGKNWEVNYAGPATEISEDVLRQKMSLVADLWNRTRIDSGGWHIFLAGWPTYSFYGVYSHDHGTKSGLFSLDNYKFDHVPYVPISFGFAINTIFYAAVLWMMFAFPFVVRRRRRIKRGLCPACAYPVGTSPVCTECGAALTIRVAAK